MTIADKITRLQNARTAIATAITNKGGTVQSGDGFEDFATDIGTIATQKEEQSKTVTPNAAGQTVTPDSGKVLSSVVINGDADLVAENVRSGIEIFGVTGTLEQLIPANCKYWAKGRISQGGNGKQGLMLKGDYQLTYGSNSTKIIAYVGASNFENGGVSLCADAASGGYNCRCVTLKGNYVDTYYNNVAQLGAILQTTGNANTSDFVLFYLVNGFTGQPTKADITQMADLKYVSSTSAVESTSAVLTNLQ